MPGSALAGIAFVRRGRIALGWVAGILSFVGFLDVCTHRRLELWADLLLSGGPAVLSARLVASRREPFLRIVHRTIPLLVAALVAILLVSSGGRAWSEYRAITTLPSPGRGRWKATLVGGFVGAAAATVVYEIVGALAFASNKTDLPLSASVTTRGMAQLLVALLSAVGAALALRRFAKTEASPPVFS